MTSRSVPKSLGLLLFLVGIIGLIVCGALTQFQIGGTSEVDCGDYGPSERVLNCFDARECWKPLCVFPDGKQLIASGPGKLTWLSDFHDRGRATLVARDLDFGDGVVAAAVSGDGKRVACYARSRTQDAIAILDAHTREVLKSWPTAQNFRGQPILRLSKDGAVLCLSSTERAPEGRDDDRATITAWDSSTGKLLNSILAPKDAYLTDFVLGSDRMLIAYVRYTDYKTISIYESISPYADAKLLQSIKAQGPAGFDSARFSADGGRLAASRHHAQPLAVYTVPSGQVIAELDKPFLAVTSNGYPGFTLSQSGKIVAVSNSDGSVILWSVQSAKELLKLQSARERGMTHLHFGPNDDTLVTYDFHAMVVWDTRLLAHDR